MAKKKSNKAVSQAKSEKKVSVGLILIIGIVFIVACAFVQKQWFPAGTQLDGGTTHVSVIDAAKTFRMTEVMSNNSSVLQDDTGAYSDWIELTNVSSFDVDVSGWEIAKDNSSAVKYFRFPSQIVKSGETVMVFCTSTTRDIPGYTYHAPFKISAAGDTLILYNDAGSALQSLNVPEMTANQSYAEIDGVWTVTNEPTPQLPNTHENYVLLRSSRKITESPIQVTELMAKNMSYAPDENGEFVDWVEIYNSGSYSVSLSGYSLTDNEANLRKWTFPNVSLGAGEYMIVYCSGYDRRDPDKPLHTNFKLSTEKEGVILTDASGNMISEVKYDLLKADQSYSLSSDGTWGILQAPTPGMANTFSSASIIAGQFAATNPYRFFINEVMASTSAANVNGASYDWVELRNSGAETLDLSGWGLSDDPSKPRKWQFPQGTTIPSGSLLCVYFSGLDGKFNSYLHTNFSLSSSEGETVVVSDPEGNIIDRMPLGRQYSDISYGRMGERDGFYYLSSATPGNTNVTTGYETRMTEPVFSIAGGQYTSSDRLSLTLTAQAGATIYYTLDCSTPDPNNLNGSTYTVDPEFSAYISNNTITRVYNGPIDINETTVVRAVSVMDGQMSSPVATQTYFVDVSHTMQIISLVMDPTDLWDYNKGFYVKGPNAWAEHPYGSLNKGANFWTTAEKTGYLELFGLDGSTILSQGCGVRLHGQFSRSEKQKSFKIIARSKYGKNRFEAPLFPNRDYTEYQSFVLRNSGQDTELTRMRDSVLTSLAADMGVMYQDTALCIVYLNGEYWGHYNMRERINTFSICQWEGWDESLKDSIDLLKANDTLMKGSKKTWTEFVDWYKKNGIDTDEELAYARKYIDVENYLNYCAVEIFTGNTDLLNSKKYRCEQQDGVWKWILFDFDWAFYTDTNSPRRWLTPGGVGDGNKYDNSLFIALMKNNYCRDYFLKLFSEKLATTWSSANVLQLMSERYEALAPEIDQHLAKFNVSRSKYDGGIKKLTNYAKTRPGRLLYFWSNVLSKSEFEYYFGELARTVDLIDDKGKTSSYYK